MQPVIYPNLTKAMKDKNISFEQMANVLGISEKAFQRRMTGETQWKLHEAVKVCDVLGNIYPIQSYLRLNTNT